MTRYLSRWALFLFAFVVTAAWAQDNSSPDPAATPQQPVPAYGQDTALPPVSDNPPLSGLDLPSLEPHAAPLNYIQPGATISESADSNAGNNLGGGSFSSITRALGSIALERLWSHYDLAVDYIGGIGYYSVNGQGVKLLQQMDLDQKITWKRGQLSLRDSFSYLPEGNFGGAYGSTGSQGISSLGTTAFEGFWGGSSLGNLGLAPRILNVSLADVTQNLTPKSSITAAGGYAFTHFYGNDVATGASFVGSSQVSAQVGYNRQITPHTQVALVYGYQGFDFSVIGTAFHSHIIQALYGHRISGRMDLLLGVGPQITLIDTQSAVCSDPSISAFLCAFTGGTLIPASIRDTKLGVSAQARLRYKFPRTSLELTYQRFETSGSGLFAGAQSDIARLSAERPLSRVWNVFADVGYARNVRIQPLSAQQLAECGSSSGGSLCPANDANSYTYGFIGGGVHRAFGRNFHGFASYQFNEISFDQTFCSGSAACNRISNRNVLTFGLDWTPRPIRLD